MLFVVVVGGFVEMVGALETSVARIFANQYSRSHFVVAFPSIVGVVSLVAAIGGPAAKKLAVAASNEMVGDFEVGAFVDAALIVGMDWTVIEMVDVATAPATVAVAVAATATAAVDVAVLVIVANGIVEFVTAAVERIEFAAITVGIVVAVVVALAGLVFVNEVIDVWVVLILM